MDGKNDVASEQAQQNARGMEIPAVDAVSVGPFPALLQSLKCMAVALSEEGHEGHSLIARRAHAALVNVEKDVTRFLSLPGSKVDHPRYESDLEVQALTFENGRATLTVASAPGSFFKVPLGECYPAGPPADAVRVMVKAAVLSLVSERLRDLETKDKLRNADRPEGAVDCERCAATGICGVCSGHGWHGPIRPVQQEDGRTVYEEQVEPPKSETIHNLMIHDSYRIGADGHCEPDVSSSLPNDKDDAM